MPRFADMIRRGMEQRGHSVAVWTSSPLLASRSVPSAFLRKWLGYADQFLLYPRKLRRQIHAQPADTLFVVTDQALGMWVPHLAHRPHVIHCHDFLALRSALGEFPEHPTGWTGRRYQRLIQNGFSRGQAFISVSKKTQCDLHRFLPSPPPLSEVVYNGLNHPFRPMEIAERISKLKTAGIYVPEAGYLLHVGGNQWYKNRRGVLEMYRAYVSLVARPAALWLIGAPPSERLRALAAAIPAPGQVCFLSNLNNEQVNAGYAHAKALLFPSLEEGFGWPIVEAMASGCPVITTDVAPMTEVAGTAARLIPRMPASVNAQHSWAHAAAKVVAEVVHLDQNERARMLAQGFANAARFDTNTALAAYAKIYQSILAGKNESQH
jgi:glycosyltransferase involved in cell wall biosynthesis